MHYVYLIINSLTNEKYIGCANNLKRRIFEHNTKQNRSTKRKAGNWELIYYEAYQSMDDAYQREKRLKQHGRAKQELFKRCINSLIIKSGAG